MRLSFGGKTTDIYGSLAKSADAVLSVARAVDRRVGEWPAGPSQDEIKELEHAADRATSELLGQINAAFVTPYDPDDLVTLAFALDDVADAAENASELLSLYGIESVTKQTIQLASLLVQATEHLAQLLGELRRTHGSSDHILRIKELEDDADDVARAARASLFRDDRIDPMIVIRWKDIYEALEDAVDACETAAHRVGNILVKNA